MVATGKRVIAQGGVVNVIVVMPDCNVDVTIPGLMASFFGNAEQSMSLKADIPRTF